MLILILLVLNALSLIVSLFIRHKPRGILTCGLFGYSGSQPVDVTKIRWLAFENKTRGLHSTGIYAIHNNKSKTKALIKDTLVADIFMDSVEVENSLPGAFSVQGHTRAATVGSITRENAHPFEFDYRGNGGGVVVGAHNGFVIDKIHGDYQYKHFGFEEPFDVDSMLIFALLAKDNNYSRLGKIEGAIATSFQFPEKYGRDLFLYKASGRELHYGLSAEGIYYSSERDPLRLIGCKSIQSLKENTVCIFRDGDLVDQQPIEKPKVTLFLNAKRDYWHVGLSNDELDQIGCHDLKSKAVTSYTKVTDPKPVAKQLSIGGMMNTKTSTETTTRFGESSDNQDRLGLIIQDVKDLVKDLTETPVDFASSNSYSSSDIESCLMLLSVNASTAKNPPLCGWTLYSKDNSRIAGITAINGTTVLRFPPSECDKPHTIVAAHPIEPTDENTFTFTFTPQKQRVMEVALVLPFPQGDEVSSQNCRVKNNKQSNKAASWVGVLSPNIQTDGSKRGECVLPDTEKIVREIQKAGKSLHTRSKNEQVHGVEGHTAGNISIEQGDKAVHSGQHTTVNIPVLNVGTLKMLIANENKIFKFKDEIKKLMQTSEYHKVYAVWNVVCGEEINVKRLLHDACLIKQYQNHHFTTSYSIAFYAKQLVTNLYKDYAITTYTNAEKARVLIAINKLLSPSRETAVETGSEKK